MAGTEPEPNRNRTVLEPVLSEPNFGSGHVTPRFARANAAISEFDL